MSAVIHDFNKSLASSHKADEAPFWEECYRQAFPDFVAMHSSRMDGEHQRQGIDRLIVLSNNKTILIDEKVRGRNTTTGKIYNDIALEYSHHYTNGTVKPGWVCKPLLCDYIAYAIAPIGKCYLLPVVQLQSVWRKQSPVWLTKYPVIESRNTSWTTRSCCVPVSEVYSAIGNALRIFFKAQEIKE